MAARPRTLPAAVAPVLVGTSLAHHRRRLPPARLRGRAGRERLHPDRHEPLERLLGRPPRRGHRGPARARASHRRRAAAAAPGAGGHLPGLRRRRGRGRLPGRRGGLGAAAWWASPRSLAGVLYTGGPRPYGYEGLGELFVFLFFGAGGRDRLVLRADRGARAGRRSRCRCRWDCWPRRSWW